ncbi:hypothetical protein [Seonamhaeicola sp.]|uniref:hypothetical protein n=1 Tax=Seonamhaeicola sp. TaxID=1912245 RepID=UPI002613E756|nr:hypothetical protein [Seonamhaeicola sp.]
MYIIKINLTIFFILISCGMDNIKFENLLGKHISVAEATIENDFSETNYKIHNTEVKFYSNAEYLLKLLDYEIKDYFSMPYINLFIETDKNDTIISINVHFQKLINRQFYNAFNKTYGEPSSILVIKKRNVISEGVENDDIHGFNQYLRKSELELREGTFEEGPLYIIWEKENYQIKALLRQQNMSEITFKSK